METTSSMEDSKKAISSNQPIFEINSIGAVSPITASETDTFVACSSAQTRVGGACKCGEDGNMTRNLASSNNDWVCSCDEIRDGTNPKAYAICANDTVTSVSVQSVAISAEDTEYEVSCTGDDIAISGSASCSDDGSNTINAVFPSGPQSWVAECDDISGSPKAYAYCVAPLSPAVSGKTVKVYESTFAGTSGTISCPAAGRMISGGCQCPNSTELDNSYTTDLNQWNCYCNGGTGSTSSKAFALCAE
ncbi:hypothetical protein GW916_08845 [bacterium]|nr:hypothetical protein [bacterium]